MSEMIERIDALLAIGWENTPDQLLRDCRAEIQRLSKQDAPIPCAWKQDDEGVYETGCDHRFVFTYGNCAENGAKFCQYCGGSIAEEFEIED